MGPIRVILLSTCLTCAGLSVVVPDAVAAPQPAAVVAPCASGAPVASDFDGDGKADLVVGANRWDGTQVVREQFVVPADGGVAGWVLDTGELRPADLNGDVCADAMLYFGGHQPWLKLAPGTPDGLDVAGAKEVAIPQAADLGDDEDRTLIFEAAGLRHDGISQVVLAGRHMWENDQYGGYVDLLTLDASLAVTDTQTFSFPGVDGDIAGFGQALATSGKSVAVGVPNAEVSGRSAAGAVHLYTVDSANPNRIVRRLVLTQNSPGVPGSAESGDHFGATLAMRNGRLAVGAPDEDDGRTRNTGLVQPIVWHEATRTYAAYRAISQDTPGVPGSNETEDRFGLQLTMARGLTASGSYDLLIGAEEDYGRLTDAGSVTVANISRALFRTITQATSGVPGSVEAGDFFSHVGVLRTSASVDTVLIGAPNEGSSGHRYAGYAIRSDGRRLGSATTWITITIPSDAPPGMTHWGVDFGAIG